MEAPAGQDGRARGPIVTHTTPPVYDHHTTTAVDHYTTAVTDAHTPPTERHSDPHHTP